MNQELIQSPLVSVQPQVVPPARQQVRPLGLLLAPQQVQSVPGIGLAAGAVIGGLVGKGGGEVVNPTGSEDLGRFVDYTVVDRNENKLGTVDAVWENGSGQPEYLAIRTGWLGMGKAHVVPAQLAEVSDRRKTIRLPLTEADVKNAPAFDCSADIDHTAEDQIGSYYKKHGYRRDVPKVDTTQASNAMRETKEEARVQLKEEQVKVGKREVEYGGVRLRKVIRTEVVNKPVELKREEIVVERVPATGQATKSCDANFSDEEIYVPLRREEAVVQKQAHVREEVRVGKKQTRETETVSETIRKEDVEIEDTTGRASQQRASKKEDITRQGRN